MVTKGFRSTTPTSMEHCAVLRVGLSVGSTPRSASRWRRGQCTCRTRLEPWSSTNGRPRSTWPTSRTSTAAARRSSHRARSTCQSRSSSPKTCSDASEASPSCVSWRRPGAMCSIRSSPSRASSTWPMRSACRSRASVRIGFERGS